MVKTDTAARRIALAALTLIILAAPIAGTAAQENVLVTLQASDTPASEVLSILADRSGLNIVTSPEEATRPISGSATPPSWRR